jgi:hypothetical protein
MENVIKGSPQHVATRQISIVYSPQHGGIYWHKCPDSLHKTSEHFYYQYLATE